MAACEECIHKNICIKLKGYDDYHFVSCEEKVNALGCSYFKDKSLFIGPYKVGDTVYVVNESEVEETTIFSIKVESRDNGWDIFLKAKVNDHGIKFKDGYGSMFKTFILGKTAFLTRKEAEKALERRVSNV